MFILLQVNIRWILIGLIFQENDGIFSFGYNENGLLGIGYKRDQKEPQKVKIGDLLKIKQIAIGAEHTLIRTGKIFDNIF